MQKYFCLGKHEGEPLKARVIFRGGKKLVSYHWRRMLVYFFFEKQNIF